SAHAAHGQHTVGHLPRQAALPGGARGGRGAPPAVPGRPQAVQAAGGVLGSAGDLQGVRAPGH
ncbi:unnamed protein product, partial [Prorocentrum cordatum]